MVLYNKIWIFLSHSYGDYEKVRLVRNLLEDEGLRPLMFFLQCLKDEEEIDELVKREIDCRTRFILCDSKEARKSKWVQREVEYIKSKDRKYETIDLEKPIEEIKKDLRQFIAQTRIFVSYNEEEGNVAADFTQRISKYEFQVYMDKLWIGLQLNTYDYHNISLPRLDLTVEDGVVVAFVNESLFSFDHSGAGSCRSELKRALEVAKNQNLDLPNVITFAKNQHVLTLLKSDPELSQLCIGKVYCLDSIERNNIVDFAVEKVLQELLPKGAILSLAENMMNGRYNKADKEEAAWLFQIAEKMTK